jgi:hypothetical protein
MRENQRCDNRCIRFDDEFRRLHAEFAPGDFLVRHRAAVAAVTRGRIADLAEVTPERHAGAQQILMQHRHDADREVAGNAAANLEHSQRALLGGRARVKIREPSHIFDAGADSVDVFHVAADDGGGIHIAERGIFPAGHDDGQVFLRGGEHPGILRVNLVKLFVFAAQQNFVKKFVREITLTLFVGVGPDFEHGFFHAAHRFAFRNAGVRHAVHVAIEQRLFVFRRQRAIARHAFVIIMRDEIENILFQIRAGAGDEMHLVLPDHFGERKAEFRRAHRAAERDHHLAAGVEVRDVAARGVHERRGIEVAVMVLDESRNRSAENFCWFFLGHNFTAESQRRGEK